MIELSSQNKTILLVSDVHHDVTRLTKILKHEAPDVAACLGDWFDSQWYTAYCHALDTCHFLTGYLLTDRFISALGNHDLPYIFGKKEFAVSGYDDARYDLVQKTLGDSRHKLRDSFVWGFWIDDWFCTHAGLHPGHLPAHLHYTFKRSSFNKWFDQEVAVADVHAKFGSTHWFYQAGEARDGKASRGGILWQDYRNEFMPISEIKQIFGHTSDKDVVCVEDKDPNNCKNIKIDCFLNEYLIIRNGKIEVKRYMDI